ncbi:MAG TPA: glycosyltransferase family 39 protein [Candidatus Cryosericum sp.]|nr:glycosyltransferase family 39 protein [Candidatus Cryosericum sp.]
MTPSRAPAFLIAVIAAVLLFTALGRSDLYNPDEPREAEMAREMFASGDRLVPRLNGEPFLEKPPLFYWLVVAAYHLAGGPGEGAARAVPALCGLASVIVTFWLARRMIGRDAAPLAALVLLTSFEFLWIARRTMIDMPLTLAVLLACAALHQGLAGGRRRVLWLAFGYAACGAAVLFKGIIGAGIPALAAVSWIAARRDWRGLWRHGLLPGAVAALVPVGFWVLELRDRLGEGAVREFVLVNNVLRFTGGAAKGHDNPFYYYLPALLTDFAPWSIVLPFALVAAARAARRPGPARDLILWFGVPLVVLSIASTKRGIYLLPILPPAAMLVAWWLTEAGASRARRAASGLLLALGILLAALTLAALRLARPADLAAPIVAGALLLVPGVAAYRALRRQDASAVALSIAGLTGIIELVLFVTVVPAVVNGGTSARAAGVELRRMEEEGDRIAFFQFKEGTLGGFLFYAGRTFPNLHDPEELTSHLAPGGEAPGPRTFALMRAPALEEVAPRVPFPLLEARRYRKPDLPWEKSGKNDYILVTRGP